MEQANDKANVVDLKSRVATSQHSELFSELRALAFRRLPALLAEVLDRADDALFDFVQKSKNSNEQQYFFDAMRELRRQRVAVEHRYRDHLGDAFAALEKRHPLVGTVAQQLERGRGGLCLVEADELEEQLAAEQVAAAADRRHGEALRQIEARLALLVQLPELDPSANPAGPVHISLAFRSGLQGLDINIQARLVLYKLFERELLEVLGPLLQDLNQRLHQAGIVPALPPPQVRRRDDGIERHVVRDRQDAGSLYVPQQVAAPTRAPGITQSGSQHPAESVDDIFVAVRDLFQAYLAAQRSHGGGLATAHSCLAVPQALSALSVVQRKTPPSLLRAVDDPQLSLAVLLKQELLQAAERMHLAEPGAGLVEQDEQALFLVGMLFDVLLSQRSYQRPVREQFVRLSVPYARAAMLDQHLFALKTHPARQLLNSMAEACDGNQGESAAERDILSRVSTVVDRLVAEFNEDISIFAELESEFRAFLDQHRRRVELAERRAAEAQRGRERLEEARVMASMELAGLLGAREVPDVLDVFLSRYWTHHLAVISLREGAASPRYRDARRAGELVWQTFLACENGAEVPADLRAHLTPVLASYGVAGGAADEVLEAIEWVLQAVRLGRLDAARKYPLPAAMVTMSASASAVEGADGPNPAPAAATAEPAAAEAAPALHVVGGKDTLDFEPADVDRVRALQIGSWVEFIDENGAAQPAKLSWQSPISSRLLFVNRRGMRYCAASAEELAAMMKQGRLRLRVGDNVFEQAMNQVLGKLREAVPASAAGAG